MVAAVSLPNESQEQNIPKKEVTHHLPPGAYPVYPQFMGLYTIIFDLSKNHKYMIKYSIHVLCILFV